MFVVYSFTALILPKRKSFFFQGAVYLTFVRFPVSHVFLGQSTKPERVSYILHNRHQLSSFYVVFILTTRLSLSKITLL